MRVTHKLTVLLILLAIAMASSSIVTAEDNEVNTDYSGWSLPEIIDDIAKIGGTKISGDIPDVKVLTADFSGGVYYEEALNLILKSFNLALRKKGDEFVVIREDAASADPDTTRNKTPESRSAQTLAEVITELAPAGVSVQHVPESNSLQLKGKTRMLSEVDKLVIALDFPVHLLRSRFYLKAEADEKPLAAIELDTDNWEKFKQAFADGKGGIEGAIGLNDDGHASIEFSCAFTDGDDRHQFSHTLLLADPALVHKHRFSIDGKNWEIGWQVEQVRRTQ
ncbi:MAG: hypothetical protein GQF41_3498 [Candidatus Rifleibacterium amylolyticum]|nr:MAG: hypothetical protein GQF41_3498 [Candidatus Rifleibacterium amylolyticum]